MTSTTNKPNWTIALGIPFLIYITCLFITFSSTFTTKSELLSNGILADLLITAPLVYFLAIRKSTVSRYTVIRVFIAGILFAGFILQPDSSPGLHIIKKWISPLIEAFVIFVICKRFYIANKNAKAKNTNKIDFLFHCRKVMWEIIGNEKVATIVSSEIAVFYYAFFSAKDRSADYKTTFTSYKENGLPIVLAAILSIFLIETTGMHFLLILWNKTIAWVLTGLSLYTCIQLFGHIRAIKSRLTIINSGSFEVHNGLAGDALIHFDNIEKIELSAKKPTGRNSVKISLLQGLESHNITVFLKTPIHVTKIFGIKKQADVVLFFVDKPKEFINSVTTQLANDDSRNSEQVSI